VKIDNNSNYILRSDFAKLASDDWLERLRIAGKCVSEIMTSLENLVSEKTNMSMLEVDKFVGAEIAKRNCESTFFQYKGFPANCCISINKTVVHGIPTDYVLKDGDVVSFDFGATFHGAIADSAMTCIFGQPANKNHITLIDTTKYSLYAGILAIKVGSRLGVIGNAIHKYAMDKGFAVIQEYGGHGISENVVHSSPFVANKASVDEGIRLAPKMTLAIEPMCVPFFSSIKTKKSSNGWDIYTEEISAHFEHTNYIHEDGSVEIITKRENELEFPNAKNTIR
jgi:methionyl aminopeptidase